MNAIFKTIEQPGLVVATVQRDASTTVLVTKALRVDVIAECGCRECRRAKSEYFAPRRRTDRDDEPWESHVLDYISKVLVVACALLFIAACYAALVSPDLAWLVRR